MAKKTLAKPYDPQIPSDRDIQARLEVMRKELENTNRVVRFGEYYISVCSPCKTHMTTREWPEMREWDKEHMDHRSDEDSDGE